MTGRGRHIGEDIVFADQAPPALTLTEMPRSQPMPPVRAVPERPSGVDVPDDAEDLVLPAGSLCAAYACRLRAAGRLDSPEGMLSLRLAHEIEFGKYDGAKVAALAGQLMRAWDKATAGAPLEPGLFDQIGQKRRERFGTA